MVKRGEADFRRMSYASPCDASRTGSIGTTAALLDPEAYRLNREKATAQARPEHNEPNEPISKAKLTSLKADKNLDAMLEAYVVEKEQIQRAIQEEVELASIRQHVFRDQGILQSCV